MACGGAVGAPLSEAASLVIWVPAFAGMSG